MWCAQLLTATQVEIFTTQATAPDGNEAYYDGLSNAVAACFAEDFDTEADDQLEAAERGRELYEYFPWRRKLLECVPEYGEMVTVPSPAAQKMGAEPDLKADPSVLMRAALSLTTLAVGDVLPQYPWEALEARMVPTIFLMLQHTQVR